MIDRTKRISIANSVLETMCPSFSFHWDNGLRISWTDWRGNTTKKRWSCAPNFYPPFHKKMACGGTQTIAIAQLARWIQGKSVLPLTTWKYWASPTVLMWTDNEKRDLALKLLQDSGWPPTPVCIFCEKEFLNGGWDWYHFPRQGVGCWSGCSERSDRHATT